MAQPFIHLRARSAYSLLQSAVQAKSLVKLAAKHDMPALGLTYSNNLFGALEFSEAAAEAGVQPIIGLSLAVKGEGGIDGDFMRSNNEIIQRSVRLSHSPYPCRLHDWIDNIYFSC